MLKKRVHPLCSVRPSSVFLCCCACVAADCCEVCFHRCPDSLDRISNTSKASRAEKGGKLFAEKLADAVCLIQDSPFRILRVAESGNVKEFTRLLTSDPSKLNVRDSRGRAPVHQATARNHVSILEVIVAFQGNLNLTDNHQNNSLHIAIEQEAIEALEFLLANKANANHLNDRSLGPLHLCAELNRVNALKVLAKFRHVLNPNLPGEHGRNALHFAAISDHEECMRILLYDIGSCPKKPCKNGFYPIHEAAKHASAGSMEILLKFGENNGCPREEMISFFDAEGNVPLHSAVHGGDIKSFNCDKIVPTMDLASKAVELCLRSGAKISTQQHDLSTPIHLACSQGAIEIVKLMFQLQPEEKDTCLKSCDLQRMTPLHCASMFDHYELVEFLVKQGSSVNALDNQRRSSLHLAAFRNGWKTIKTLIRLGANVSLKDNDSRNVLHAAVIHGGDLDRILDDEFCSEFIPILEEKDKHGYTALHYAVKQGHIKNAMKLISLGASIVTKNNVGENVLHIACRFGRLNIVQKILKMEQNNSVINEGDGKGLTPLHSASMFGHVRVVQALIKKGALLHRDHNGSNIAHLAAKNGHRETMKLILNVHSHLLDQTDKDGNTPIHIASMENQPEAVELLLTLNCNLTYNYKGFSAIDFALQNKFSAVALVMVTHRTRGNEILAMSSGKYPSIMLALVATFPSVVAAVLDRCIIKSDAKMDSENYHIKYDFKWLALTEPEAEQITPKTGEKVEEKFQRNSFERKHLPILNGMVYHGRVELLSHDLSQKYLQMKWNAYGKYIHFSHLILYLCYLGILTSFASGYLKRDRSNGSATPIIHGPATAMAGDVNYLDRTRVELAIDPQGFIANSSMASLSPTIGNSANHIHSTQHPSTESSPSSINGSWATSQRPQDSYRNGSAGAINGLSTEDARSFNEYIKATIILTFAIINILRECTHFYHLKIKYIMDTVNWVFWAMNICCVFMIASKFIPLMSKYADPSASLAAFFSWFYLLLFLQRFDVVGIYVVMFLEILHTLLRVLMIFSILIVAFGLAFYILLSDGQHKAFTEIPIALLRTFSMMLGEMDFLNTFVNPHFCGGSAEDNGEHEFDNGISPFGGSGFAGASGTRGHVNFCTDERRLPHPISSFLMLGIFMVFMPILLMNLLIGLAVGDIESVRRNAQLKRLAMQVLLHTHLEKNLPKFILQKVDKSEVIEYPNARKARLGVIDQFFKYFQPKSARKADDEDSEENASNDMILALHQSNETLANVSAHLENLETLMRLLCQKMELATEADFIDEGTQVDDNNPMSDIRTRFKRGVTVRVTRRPKPQRFDSTA